MTTYREAIYMCLDLLKGMSDDFTYTEDHIAYLLDKARAYLLLQLYGKDPKKHIPYSNYQTIELQFVGNESDKYIKSEESLPHLIQLGIPRVTTDDYYNYNFEFTSRERLPFVGNNKFLKNIVYCAIDNNNKLLVQNKECFWEKDQPTLPVMKLSVVGLFENPKEVIGEDYMDEPIPIEETLVQQLITTVMTFIASSVYRPTDDHNDNRDDNAALATFLKLNVKPDLAKQLQ